jgi:hypothetical protein
MTTFDDHVGWNDDFIVFWATKDDERIRCAAPRKLVNELPGFKDANKQTIGERRKQVRNLLVPHALEKIRSNDYALSPRIKTVYLSAVDLRSKQPSPKTVVPLRVVEQVSPLHR